MKTDKCIVGSCTQKAVRWEGFLIRSRGEIEAGFCSGHSGQPGQPKCPNHIRKGCWGIYDKSLGER